jgi:tRNA(Leu) C34 or U34 (ribose-2'-O)-methylase TrmL
MRGRLEAALVQLASSGTPPDAAVLLATFQLSGAEPRDLLDELLAGPSSAVHTANLSLALTRITAGAVLLSCATESSATPCDFTPMTRAFAVALCLPLLVSREARGHTRAVATALASAVACTDAWHLGAQLLHECLASLATDSTQWRLQALALLAAESKPLRDAEGCIDADGQHVHLFSQEAACVVAGAMMVELCGKAQSSAASSLARSSRDMLACALSALGHENTPASVDAALVRDVTPSALELCHATGHGAAAAAALRDAATALLASPRLQCQRAGMALLARFAGVCVRAMPSPGHKEEGDPFWVALRCCLWHPEDTRLRKQALHVLRCALGPDRCAAGGWATWLIVADGIEDYSLHLASPAFQRLRLLHPPAGSSGAVGDSEVPLPWVGVLWCKAVTHENPHFRRQALDALAESEWSGDFGRVLPESAIHGPLLDAVNDPTNHGGDDPIVAAAGVAAAAAAYVCSAGQLRTERGDAARRLLTAIVERSPTRQGLAAMLHVARAACQACAQDADTELEPVAQGDLSLELLRRLSILGCLQWGSIYRANAAQVLLDAGSAITPAVGGASVAAIGRFLDALTRTGGLTGASCAQLRAGAAQWLAAGGPEQVVLFAQALDAHAAGFLKGDASTGEPADPAASISAEELSDWASSARHIAMLWSLLPDAACKLALASRLQAAGSGVYARAHAPQGWTLRVLLLLDAMARAADAREEVMHGVAVSCVAEVAALARAALCRGLLAPVSPDAPLGLSGAHHGGGGLSADRCGISPTGGPPSVLAPSRVDAGHVACAALSALCACNRWRHLADAARDDEAAATAWRQCDADLWRMLSYCAFSAPQGDEAGLKTAAEMHDTALACVALAVEALVPDGPGSNPSSPIAEPPEDVQHTAEGVASHLFAFVTHLAADDGQPTRRTAGGMPSFLAAPEASQRGGAATCAGSRWRAVSSVLRLSGARCPVTLIHSLALGGAIASCVDVARGDSADVFRAVHTLLPVLLASVHADGGQFVKAAAEKAARAAGDDTLIDLHQDECEGDPSGPLDEQLLTEQLAPLARALCRCIWAGLSDTPNRPVIVLAECLAAALHPALFSVASLHAPRTGPLRWFVRRLLAVSEQSGRLMRLSAAALWSLWLQFPTLVTTAQYDMEMARINLFSVADHDADYAEDLIDPGAAAALLAVPGGTDAASFGAFAGEALAVRVTGVCAAHQLACRGSVGGEGDARDAARALLRRLLHSVLHDPELSMETYRKNSVTHRRKVRAWQLLAALAPTLPVEGDTLGGSDAGLMQLLEQCFLSTLDKLNLPSVKQYEEAFFTAVLLRAPSLLHSHVVPALDVTQSTSRPYTLASLVLIAHAYLRHEPDLGKQRDALPAIFAAVVPWTCTHNHSLRTFAQTVMFELFDAFPVGHPAWSGSDGAGDAFKGTAGGVLAAMRTFFVLNDDCIKTRLATGRVGSMHPSVACTPAVIFGRGPECPFQVGLRFEGAPTPLVERISAFLDNLRVDTRMSRITAEGAFLMQPHQAATTAPLPGPGPAAPSLQKKVEPPSAALDLLLGSTDDPLDGGQLGRGGQVQERQDLVLCASLVDKATNLGGLARTAEVFRLHRLVINDLSVVQNPVFKAMAVTAERHVPIAAVPGGALPSFLAAKRAEGYSLVGLEQTTGSISMPDYAFPQRCVLLLGAEGVGIPADLLPLLDACVEIPQPGKAVRSLNVHVSAALAVYSYTCQWHKDG